MCKIKVSHGQTDYRMLSAASPTDEVRIKNIILTTKYCKYLFTGCDVQIFKVFVYIIKSIKEMARSFSMDAFAGISYGMEINSQKEKNGAFMRHASKAFDLSFNNPVALILVLCPSLLSVLKYIARLGQL